MTNYYLKTTDEASLWAALETAGLARKEYDMEDENNQRPDDLDPEADWEMTGAFDWVFTGTALDIIGSIYAPTGNTLTDEEGVEYPEMAAIDGFHANLKAEFDLDEEGNVVIPDGLPTIEAPSTPYRKWAGE
jgi:hypothetical protein